MKQYKTFIYRIDWITDYYEDYGFEYIEARTTDEAIDFFRQYYKKDKYHIIDVFKRIGKESGKEVWKDR